MSIIITDSEYTAWPGALESDWWGGKVAKEIFQIGAVRVDEDFRVLETFERIVRPTLNPQLSELSIQLTGVTQERIDSEGVEFKAALQDFVTFAGDNPTIICMDGDSKVVRENCKVNQVEFPYPQDFHRLKPLLRELGVQGNSGKLHSLTPHPLQGPEHDAVHDSLSMACWLRYSKGQGVDLPLSPMPTELPKYGKNVDIELPPGIVLFEMPATIDVDTLANERQVDTNRGQRQQLEP